MPRTARPKQPKINLSLNRYVPPDLQSFCEVLNGEDHKLVADQKQRTAHCLCGRFRFAGRPRLRRLEELHRAHLAEENAPGLLRFELRSLVERWKREGLAKMLKDPQLGPWDGSYYLVADGTGISLGLEPAGLGRSIHGEKGQALRWFKRLIIDPEVDKFGGPCARCHRYYVKKRNSQKVYCSARCGHNTTATARATQKRRQKLEVATLYSQRWLKSRSRLDWKEWVARNAQLDKKFLTRAVTKGDLQVPLRRKQLKGDGE